MALPALLRAKKVLVVGDDKQVSPEGIGMKEDAIKSIMTQLLGKQVPQYKVRCPRSDQFMTCSK